MIKLWCTKCTHVYSWISVPICMIKGTNKMVIILNYCLFMCSNFIFFLLLGKKRPCQLFAIELEFVMFTNKNTLRFFVSHSISTSNMNASSTFSLTPPQPTPQKKENWKKILKKFDFTKKCVKNGQVLMKMKRNMHSPHCFCHLNS